MSLTVPSIFCDTYLTHSSRVADESGTSRSFSFCSVWVSGDYFRRVNDIRVVYTNPESRIPQVSPPRVSQCRGRCRSPNPSLVGRVLSDRWVQSKTCKPNRSPSDVVLRNLDPDLCPFGCSSRTPTSRDSFRCRTFLTPSRTFPLLLLSTITTSNYLSRTETFVLEKYST